LHPSNDAGLPDLPPPPACLEVEARPAQSNSGPPEPSDIVNFFSLLRKNRLTPDFPPYTFWWGIYISFSLSPIGDMLAFLESTVGFLIGLQFRPSCPREVRTRVCFSCDPPKDAYCRSLVTSLPEAPRAGPLFSVEGRHFPLPSFYENTPSRYRGTSFFSNGMTFALLAIPRPSHLLLFLPYTGPPPPPPSEY